jgi:hypothetical protein
MNVTVASPIMMLLEHEGGEFTFTDPIAPEPAQAEALLRVAVQQAVHQALDVLPLDELAKVADGIFCLQRGETVHLENIHLPVHWGSAQDNSMRFLGTGYAVPAPATKSDVYEGLAGLAERLKAMHWEQQGMLIPNDATIDRALRTLDALATMTPGLPQPEVVATPAGGIQLEWHNRRFDLEVNVSSPGEVDAYLIDVRLNRRFEFENLLRAAELEPLSDVLKKML